ncbi:MAG: four helix bundle protein [Rhodothermales bacterium]
MEVNTPPICAYQNLRVYQYATTLAEDTFWITRTFPGKEQQALTDQLRRTAQTIPRNVLQGWNRRYCGCAFRNHLDEAQSACARLGLWFDLARDRGYLTKNEHQKLTSQKNRIQRMLTRLHNYRIALLA